MGLVNIDLIININVIIIIYITLVKPIPYRYSGRSSVRIRAFVDPFSLKSIFFMDRSILM